MSRSGLSGYRHFYQQRGALGRGRYYLAYPWEHDEYEAQPWYKRLRSFEYYMKKKRGDSIYR